LAQRSSRKKRKQRQRSRVDSPSNPPADSDVDEMSRGYARGRAKDEAARAALKPLRRGERPTAVTVAAIVAGLLFAANLVALGVGYRDGESQELVSTIAGAVLLAVMGVGMWQARYWAVLGMQALLGITIVFGSLALIAAANVAAAILALAIIVLAGTLFWFLVKAMARIQMPQRPGSG